MSKNNFNFGFQPIQDFTFDQCFSRIENNRNSGIENDEELLTHYTKLLCQLQQRDDTLYKKASTKKELQIYLSSYPLDSTAKNYHLRHAEKALKRIAKIEENEKVGKKKKIVSVLSFVAVAIIAVCLFNYEPVKYLNVGDTLTCSKYGDSIRLEVQTNVPSSLLKVDLDSSCKWLQVLGKDGNYNLVIKQNPIGSRNTIIKISAPNRLFGETVSWDYKTINISQESGIPTYITPERKSISFDKFGKPLDKSDLIISTDGVLESATSKPDWCDISFKHLNSGRYRCIVTMDKNNGTVVDPSATVSADLMNMLYAGYSNPISISVPGVPVNKIQATMTNGTLQPVGPGKYIARPQQIGKDATITVVSTNTGRAQQMGQFTFRVRKLPDPTPYITLKDDQDNPTRYKGGNLSKQALMGADGIGAAIDDGILDIGFKVLAFECVFFDNMGNAGPIVCEGSAFSQRQKDTFRRLARNRRFYISRVKAIGPDGIERQLPTSMEVIVK